MRRLLLLLATLLVVGCTTPPGTSRAPATADGRPSPLAVMGVMPAQIERLARDAAPIDFEALPGGAGMGAGLRYGAASGSRGLATVYFYDGTPPRSTPPNIGRELELAMSEVMAVSGRQGFRVVGATDAAPIRAPDGNAAMACRRMLLAYRDGRRAESYVCIGPVGGRLLKLRMTLPLDTGGESVPDLLLLMAAMREAEMVRFGTAMLAAVVERTR